MGASEAMLAPSPRLVGGVEPAGDALSEVGEVDSLWTATVMHESVEAGDVGEPSGSAMVRFGEVTMGSCGGQRSRCGRRNAQCSEDVGRMHGTRG